MRMTQCHCTLKKLTQFWGETDEFLSKVTKQAKARNLLFVAARVTTQVDPEKVVKPVEENKGDTSMLMKFLPSLPGKEKTKGPVGSHMFYKHVGQAPSLAGQKSVPTVELDEQKVTLIQ